MIPLPTEPPQILFQDDDLIVLFKPSHMHVHPPEDHIVRKAIGRHTCIHWLTDTHQINANPVHRLDSATEGLLLFTKNTKTNLILNTQMQQKQIQKFYDAVVRGWLKDSYGEINLQLELDSTKTLVDCKTLYSTIAKIELPFTVGAKFKTTRYSLLDVELKTGRWHQIRRHMNHIDHPIVGDGKHGDSRHNVFFRETLGIDGLCLKAKRIEFYHPYTDEKMIFHAPLTEKWSKLNQLFANPS